MIELAISPYLRRLLNQNFPGQVPFLARLGDQIYALQKGLTEGQTDPFTGEQVPEGIGFSSDSVYGFAVGVASADVTAAGTAVATSPVAWPQQPRQWSVTGPVGASVESISYNNGQVTFTVNASATGTVTVYFS